MICRRKFKISSRYLNIVLAGVIIYLLSIIVSLQNISDYSKDLPGKDGLWNEEDKHKDQLDNTYIKFHKRADQLDRDKIIKHQILGDQKLFHGNLAFEKPKAVITKRKSNREKFNEAIARGDILQHEIGSCSSSFLPTVKENADKLLHELSTHDSFQENQHILKPGLPTSGLKDEKIMVTAMSSNHFAEGEGVPFTMEKYFGHKYKLIVFDLGLISTEIDLIKSGCKFCEYRKFPFDKYPSFVKNLNGFSWKPLIIHMMLHEYRYVAWCDASVRFKTSNISGIWDYAEENHIAIYDAGFNTTCFTHPFMFDYYNEQACLFVKAFQLEANFMVMHSSDFTRHVLSLAWSACGLDPTCMAPKGSAPFGCNRSRSPNYCNCHRFDQSALTILVYRLFSKTAYPTPWVLPKSTPWIYPTSICDIKRGDHRGSGYLSRHKN